MKIALAQIDYHIGNFEKNVHLIISTIQKAKKDKTDLLVFSELSVCGYPPLDLLERKIFIDKAKGSIDEIATHCDTIAAIVGVPTINPNPEGKMLYNSACFLYEGKVQQIVNKTLLPTYDIFDEYRYFEPNTDFNIINFKGKKIALTICEDIWDHQPQRNTFQKQDLYTVSPLEHLSKHDPDFIVNIAASPFSYTRITDKLKILSDNAKKYKIPLFYVNQTGANTELVFDGGSMVFLPSGRLHDKLKDFEEDYQTYDIDEVNSSDSFVYIEENAIESIYKALVRGVKDYFGKTGFKKALLGLSGGIDSAVTLAVAEKALGNENVHVLLMPSKYSSDHSITDAVDLAENLNVSYDIIKIEDVVASFDEALSPIFKDLSPDVAEENIQARIRGTLLMAFSNKFNHILLNTSNKSEAAVGYGTLYGDMNGGLSVLGDVYKTDVFRLARYINLESEIIPINTIEKPPSAELRPDQKDSDSLPDYDQLDAVLFEYIELHKSSREIIDAGFDEEIVKRTVKLVDNNEYKRYQTPPILRISEKAFGLGRRIPLVAKYI